MGTDDDNSAATFDRIWRNNEWGSAESVSGPGSTLEQTAALRAALPGLLRDLSVRRFLDVPCGDFHWMKAVDLGGIDYVGGDIAPGVVAGTRVRHARPGVRFAVLDLVRDRLPQADLIQIRDCLVHLPLEQARLALANAARAAPWILTTTFPGIARNKEIETGDWRRLDLCLPPFGLPAPARLINEGLTGPRNRMKSMGLWRAEDIAAAFDKDGTP